MEGREEEGDEMEIEEEEDSSLESIEFPTNTRLPSNKVILKNQMILAKNQKKLKRSFSKKVETISTKMTKLFGKVGRKLGLSSSSSSSAEF